MLDEVLKRIDDDLERSLERLFMLLRIESISTDPAYAASVKQAAEWLVGELRGLGFDASARSTPGHPIVVAHAGTGTVGPKALFYGHYDVQPVDPLDLWETPPFQPRLATMPDGSRRIVARGAADDKGQLMTFVEACRAWKAATGRLPVGLDSPPRGRGGMRQRQPRTVPQGECRGAHRRYRARLRHEHVGPPRRRRSP